jgi:hypothetical protein
MRLAKTLIATTAIGLASHGLGKATIIEEGAKDIAVKLTPEQVTKALEENLIGNWTVVDKESKAVIHKWKGRWNERGISVKGKGVDFENGTIKNKSSFVTSYNSEIGFFVQNLKVYEDGNQNNLTRHISYDPNHKVATLVKVSPKPPIGITLIQEWKTTGPNRTVSKFEVYEKGELVFKREVIMTRKVAKSQKPSAP